MNLNKIVFAHDEETTHPRREFLRKTLLLSALPLGAAVPFASLRAATMSTALPPMRAAANYVPPTRQRGSAVRNVRDYGAVGNGSHDDTAAFQSAINSLPADGGTVVVPVGTYKIDAVRGVKLRSRMHLKMDPNAKLVAAANGADHYAVLDLDRITDVEISGGHVIGDADSHKSNVNAGGQCIHVRGSERVTVRDIRVSKAWSTGVSVGARPVWRAPLRMARDVVLVGVVSTSNRRNALAITNAVDVKVYDSEFSGTRGVKPQVGIDVEPNDDAFGNNDYCDRIHIENCVISENARSGIVIWRRARGVTVKNCVLHRNASSGLFTEAAENVVITGNTVSYNGANGLYIRPYSRNFQVNGNTSFANYTKLGVKQRAPFDLVGVSPKVERDIIVSSQGTSGINVGLNHYR